MAFRVAIAQGGPEVNGPGARDQEAREPAVTYHVGPGAVGPGVRDQRVRDPRRSTTVI